MGCTRILKNATNCLLAIVDNPFMGVIYKVLKLLCKQAMPKMIKTKRDLVKTILKLREKDNRLAPLSVAHAKIVEGELLVDSVYGSARLEGSRLSREDVQKIIAAR